MKNKVANVLKEFKIFDNIDKISRTLEIEGISKEGLGYLLKANSEKYRQIFFIVKDEYELNILKDRMSIYDEYETLSFPPKDLLFYNMEALSHEVTNSRIEVMDKLIKKEKISVVASIKSIVNKIMSKNSYIKNTFFLEIGKSYDLEDIIEKLVCIGYERVSLIESKDQFSLRGGILDIYPSYSNNPYRMEFFDDEVDSIREFDVKTQRSLDNVDKISIVPTKEIVLDKEEKESTLKNLKIELEKDIVKSNDDLRIKIKRHIEKLENDIEIKNLDFLIPYMNLKLENILDYLDEKSLIIISDRVRVEEELKSYFEGHNLYLEQLMVDSELTKDHLRVSFNKNEIVNFISRRKTIFVRDIINTKSEFIIDKEVEIKTRTVPNFQSQIKTFVSWLKEEVELNKKIFIFGETKEKTKLIGELLEEKNIKKYTLEDRINKDIDIALVDEKIDEGIEFLKEAVIFVSHKNIFGTRVTKRKRKKNKYSKKIDSFVDLKIGDFVVHESHGIGKYIGIEQINVEKIKKDYIVIQYLGEDKLYIPVNQMNLVQKYIGSDNYSPKLNRLNSLDWQKSKLKVKSQIEDMAKELIKLYATRESIDGFKYSKDTLWQKEFEDSFPYEETEDQLRSVEEIKFDMENIKPMDRLLCGDVGYGKTEVAIRAMFKAVSDSKQVLFLVPTTILAQQHYNTIKNRVNRFPIIVESLSRFKSMKEQKEILEKLKIGEIDILVGTHKVLSDKVKYKDLGLMIVDEEQRFGVKQKEKIKSIKNDVDVLTLTATPIPRTLHMSLSGIRSMSILEEPPEERLPIQTYVVEYNDSLIKNAIDREVARGGQVYFLYNKVKTIEEFTTRVRSLVPNAKVSYAHGQMGEKNLESTMMDFYNKKIDVLVCTTIIETGLDIENVNTIIVYDSDKMGLSQLYQLRGRVGRSSRIAYAYFTYEKNKVLTEVSEKRLKAIKEFTEFGSGFKVAMRDLEIRGAGNLLGSSQHGQMATIGYELYVKYLENAINRIKGKEVEENIDTVIEANISGFISEEYIEDELQKLEIYKKISEVSNKEEKMDLIEEMIDRYGDVSKDIENLIDISIIKTLAGKNHIVSIKEQKDSIAFKLDREESINKINLKELLDSLNDSIKIKLGKEAEIEYFYKDKKNILLEIEKIVKKISKD